MVSIDVVTELNEITPELKQEWDSLIEKGSNPLAIFQSYDWVESMYMFRGYTSYNAVIQARSGL